MESSNMGAPAGAPRTAAEALGQIVWLLSQSPLHRELRLKDLEWSIMPAVMKEQFRIFRFGPLPGLADPAAALPPGLDKTAIEQLPLGVAIWAKLSAEAEAKLERGERLEVEEWTSGDRTWLIELISPFANAENKLLEVMLTDLAQGPFRGRPFCLHRTDPQTGQREKITFDQHLAET
jgi:cytolysin-activating lysine-acyltransferase